MHCFLAISLFFTLLLSRKNSILVETFDLQDIKNDHINFGVSCPNDYCQFSQTDSLESQACHCGVHCIQLGTCCFDSPYADVPQPKRKPVCRFLYEKGFYFIVHKCSFTDSVWASQCNDESIGDDDLQKLVPVTSLVTNITYKNYYCFRCYEAGDEFTYWTLKIQQSSVQFRITEPESRELSKRISYIYDKKKNEVLASFCGGIGYFPVSATLEIPSEVKNMTHLCYESVISDCAEDWPDDETRNKCLSYMAIKEVERIGRNPILYKNIHCAICNYETLNGISCMKARFLTPGAYGGGGASRYGSGAAGYGSGAAGYSSGAASYGGGAGGSGEAKFSFDAVFNINPSKDSNNEQADKNQKCSEDQHECKTCSDGEEWNPFAKVCKKLTCLVPGHKVKNNKCVKE